MKDTCSGGGDMWRGGGETCGGEEGRHVEGYMFRRGRHVEGYMFRRGRHVEGNIAGKQF